MKQYTIAIAGSTKRTTLCAEALKNNELFSVPWILTPKPKPSGRKKIITPNPLDTFAQNNKIATVYVESKIDESIKKEITIKPDFLLVVDFGYIIPSWLLDLPKIAPLNIHPSELPKWRGSSPGQFSILFNDKKSAVTLMKINDKFDQGPIIHQDFFEVSPEWNQEDYYSYAFKTMCNGLGEKIAKFAENENSVDKVSTAKPQPEKSPTIMAKMLKKDQAFVAWETVKIAMRGEELSADKTPQLSKLLITALEHNKSLALTLERASKAFSPWPNLWTMVQTAKGERRMKLLGLELESTPNQINDQLILKTIQIEGKNPTSWNEVKKQII